MQQVPLNERLRQQGCRVGVGRRRSRNREKQSKSDEMSENCFFRSFHLSSLKRQDKADDMGLCTPLASPHAGQSRKTKRDVPTSSASPIQYCISPSSELFHQSAQRCASCPTRAFLLDSLPSYEKNHHHVLSRSVAMQNLVVTVVEIYNSRHCLSALSQLC